MLCLVDPEGLGENKRYIYERVCGNLKDVYDTDSGTFSGQLNGNSTSKAGAASCWWPSPGVIGIEISSSSERPTSHLWSSPKIEASWVRPPGCHLADVSSLPLRHAIHQ